MPENDRRSGQKDRRNNDTRNVFAPSSPDRRRPKFYGKGIAEDLQELVDQLSEITNGTQR